MIRQVLKRLDPLRFRCYCPICRSQLRSFQPFGVRPRPNALCPVCGSLERHRLVWMYLEEEGATLFTPPKKRMLHAAPEACMSKLFQRSEYIDYISIDIEPCAMIRVDLTSACFPNDTFDVIYASHVLEHIPDDRKAMREIFRILKRGGTAILQVPINAKVTFEDSTIITPSQRECVFGQSDHVRIYGEDYYERLKEAGFEVQRKKVRVQLDRCASRRIGVSRDEEITLGIKE